MSHKRSMACHSGRAAWGQDGGREDLDGSGIVDFDDLLLLLAAWGPCE